MLRLLAFLLASAPLSTGLTVPIEGVSRLQPDLPIIRSNSRSNAQVPIAVTYPKFTDAIVDKGALGRVPALGWNSWNAYKCDIDEGKIIDASSQLIHLGLQKAGYQYVNIDDCWSNRLGRDPKTQKLVADPDRFPSGMAGLADEIHSRGFRFGIYSSAGTRTCAGFPASLGFEEIDAKTFDDWGVDYLKYDNCEAGPEWIDSCDYCLPDSQHVRGPFPNGTCITKKNLCPEEFDYTKSKTFERFRRMRDALNKTKRPIQYALCEWGNADVQSWGNNTGSSWRATADIEPNWPRIIEILNIVSFKLANTGFWGHSDADMLEVGNGALTSAETRSHFALWAAMKSPLLIGTDLTKLTPENLALLKNPYLLSFNQDPIVGGPATPYRWGANPDWTWNATYPAEFWSGKTSVKLDDKSLQPIDNSRVAGTMVATDLHWLAPDAEEFLKGSQYLIDGNIYPNQPPNSHSPPSRITRGRGGSKGLNAARAVHDSVPEGTDAPESSTDSEPPVIATEAPESSDLPHPSVDSEDTDDDDDNSAFATGEEFGSPPEIDSIVEDSVLVLLSNWSEKPANRAAMWTQVPDLPPNAPASNGGSLYEIIDIWTGKSLGCFNRGFSTIVQPHDTVGLWIRVCRSDT